MSNVLDRSPIATYLLPFLLPLMYWNSSRCHPIDWFGPCSGIFNLANSCVQRNDSSKCSMPKSTRLLKTGRMNERNQVYSTPKGLPLCCCNLSLLPLRTSPPTAHVFHNRQTFTHLPVPYFIRGGRRNERRRVERERETGGRAKGQSVWETWQIQ